MAQLFTRAAVLNFLTVKGTETITEFGLQPLHHQPGRGLAVKSKKKKHNSSSLKLVLEFPVCILYTGDIK